MRMWMVDPEIMCRKHLLGEHVELHMLVGSLNKNKSLDGYISRGLIQVESIVERHEALVKEMKRRGYNHNSPLPEISYREEYMDSHVNSSKSTNDLLKRCRDCRQKHTFRGLIE